MSRPDRTICRLTLAALLFAALGPAVTAQGTGPISGTPFVSTRTPEPPAEESIAIRESNVGILDPAPTMNILRLRVDLGFHNVRPTRAEFILPKGGLPGGRGLGLPETGVRYLDVRSYGEYAVLPFLSSFAEVPYRLLNPEVNPNRRGLGDTNFGLKLCTWSDQNVIVTFMFRVWNPTAGDGGLGTAHWTVEPALIASWRFLPQFLLEGEANYFAPVGGTDFAGDVVRYGVGLSWGQRNPDNWWALPVAEGVGWSVLGGKEMVVAAPDSYVVRDAQGETIANGYLGLRFGYGAHFDSYVGYGRCFTRNSWFRDFARVEMRLIY